MMSLIQGEGRQGGGARHGSGGNGEEGGGRAGAVWAVMCGGSEGAAAAPGGGLAPAVPYVELARVGV
jgi:hypothetical protein